MGSDIWKGNEDFFNRFNHQDNAPRPRLVGGKLINTSSGSFMKESSMEKSFKKESSSSLSSNFASNSFTSDSDFGLSRRWLMPKGIFDEDLARFQLKDEVLCIKMMTTNLKYLSIPMGSNLKICKSKSKTTLSAFKENMKKKQMKATAKAMFLDI